MKTFASDKPVLRYSLMFLGVGIASFTGTVAAILLVGVLVK